MTEENFMDSERRQYNRMFFSKQDGPVASFTLPDPHEKTISAIVMDLSLGGLGLSIRKNENMVNIGDHLILTKIKGSTGLQTIANIETKVRWIQNYENFDHILFGCEFLNASESLREQIQQFINSWAEDAAVRR